MKLVRSRACIIFLASIVLILHHHYYIATKSSTNFEFFSQHHNVAPISSGICVFYNFAQATGLRNGPIFTDPSTNSTYEPITLCLHTTMDKAHDLWEHITNWDDFISVSLLVRAGEEECLDRLVKAWRCYKPFHEKVSLHVVWRQSTFQEECSGPDAQSLEPLSSYSEGEEEEHSECVGLNEEYSRLEPCGLAIPDLFYPYTRMHNVARRGAGTQLHLVGDIDTAFSLHFAKRVRPLTQRHLMQSDSTPPNNKKVLVFRRFEAEVDKGKQPPRTIEALAEQIKQEKANFFHGRFFAAGHFIPGLEEWLEHGIAHPHDEVHLTRLNYTRYLPVDDKKNAHFEPQFISHASAPLAYEQMLGRHYTRQVLASELCRADYEFWLLSHVFNVHPGIKLNRTTIDKLMIEMNRGEHKNIFHDSYNAYIDARYPKKEQCPPPAFW